MNNSEEVFEKLEKLNINYKIVEHKEATTTEKADEYIEGHEGVRTKTLFLKNRKKKNLYLIVMDDEKRVNMKALEKILEDKGLGFCSDELLMEKMKLEPGVVSLFGLINNEDKDIKIIFDEDVINEEIFTFHANVNTITVFISKKDMIKFTEELGYEYKIIKIPE